MKSGKFGNEIFPLKHNTTTYKHETNVFSVILWHIVHHKRFETYIAYRKVQLNWRLSRRLSGDLTPLTLWREDVGANMDGVQPSALPPIKIYLSMLLVLRENPKNLGNSIFPFFKSIFPKLDFPIFWQIYFAH